MGKIEKIEKLQKLKESGAITEQEFNAEKEKLINNKRTNNKKIKVIIAIMVLVILIAGGIFATYYFNNNSTETSTNENNATETTEEGFEQTSANVYANGTDNVSFANMNSDDENYNSTQQEILKYFDNNYFAYNSSLAQKYPQIFKEAKVQLDCTVVKVLSSHAFGKVIEIIKKSNKRVESDCKTYKRCGGCELRHIEYKETLKMKQNAVQSLVNKTLKNKIQVQEVLGMENPYYYRNKVQFPVGTDKNGNLQMGVYASRTHEIIPIEKCYIQNQKAEKLAKIVFKYWKENNLSAYNEKNQKGLLRHIIVKVGIRTNEYMCILVVNNEKIPNEKQFAEYIKKEFPEITTIVINTNKKNTNVILGENNRNILGNGYIKDKLGDYTFKISPLSFYQVNPIQAEKLYKIGVDQAKITKNDIVFDLYCGIGTISLFMSKYAKKVYGVEIVKEAIEAAKENAKINNIQNTEFLAGDVEKVLTKLLKERNIKPDIIVVDPPRKGLDKVTIKNILNVRPRKLVYISCNPATLVRDLKELEEEYDIGGIKPVDMFPFTKHVECVALMGRKDNESE